MSGNKSWQEKNYANIVKRLSRLIDQPSGVIYSKRTNLHKILIRKIGTDVRCLFEDPTEYGIMSRIDLLAPLNLLAVYTQAMMLSLLWQSDPTRVYLIGFAGGRIPMIFHHYFPEVRIESTDIEPMVVEIASRYFGIQLDDRLKVVIEDGRKYLARSSKDTRYDTILVDAFRGPGYGPYHLSTTDFYETCTQHLTEAGVVVVNLWGDDELYINKIATFKKSFANIYMFKSDNVTILFGTNNSEVSKDDLIRKAQEVQDTHTFLFPFAERAQQIITGDELAEYLPILEDVQILTDAVPPEGYFDNLSSASTIFSKVGRNDPCPCGSGKKFKRCHGLNANPSAVTER